MNPHSYTGRGAGLTCEESDARLNISVSLMAVVKQPLLCEKPAHTSKEIRLQWRIVIETTVTPPAEKSLPFSLGLLGAMDMGNDIAQTQQLFGRINQFIVFPAHLDHTKQTGDISRGWFAWIVERFSKYQRSLMHSFIWWLERKCFNSQHTNKYFDTAWFFGQPVPSRALNACTHAKIAHMYVCMYLLIGKGQIAQKRPYWGENRLKGKNCG